MNLVLPVLFFFAAAATAGEFEDRQNADYARQHAENQKQFMAKAVKQNEAYREKVYRWTYQFTGGSPVAAQQATCIVEAAWCHYSSCMHLGAKETVKLDALVGATFAVRQCEVKLPAPHDLVCRLSNRIHQISDKGYKSVTEASCYDKYSQPKHFVVE